MLSQRDFFQIADLQVCLCHLKFFLILKSKQRFKSFRWRCPLLKYILFLIWFESFIIIYVGFILYQLDSALWLWLVYTWLCWQVIVEVKDVLALQLYWEKRISCRSFDWVLFVLRVVRSKVLHLVDWAVNLWEARLRLLPVMVILSCTLKSCFYDGLARGRYDCTNRFIQI